MYTEQLEMGSARKPQPRQRGGHGGTARDRDGGQRKRPGGLSPPATFSCAYPNVNNTISTWPQAGVIFIIYESPGQERSSRLYRVCTHFSCLRGALRGSASRSGASPPLPTRACHPWAPVIRGTSARREQEGTENPSSSPQVVRNPSRVDTDISPQLQP